MPAIVHNRPSAKARQSWGRGAARSASGFTLLEVILALALSVIVLFAISMAIYLHLSVLDRRRGKIERAQLARNILQLMAKDIRSAVQYKPVDVSQLEQMMSGADLTSLLGSEAAAAALDTAGGGAAAGAGGTGSIADLQALAGGGTPSTNAPSSMTPDLTGLGLGGEDAPSAAEDIAGSVAPPTEPGIYGNESELMVDTSKLPRKDQYNPLLASSVAASSDIPSDIKTVAYYLQLGAGAADVQGDPFSTQENENGLVRREVARAVARYATDNGSSLDGLGKVDLIAPEVTSLSFRYFDGTDWLTEWDSESTGSLPFAIEITLGLTSQQDETRVGLFTAQEDTEEELFRLVVHIPMAEEPTEEEIPEDGTATDGTATDEGANGTGGAAGSGAPAGTGGTGTGGAGAGGPGQ